MVELTREKLDHLVLALHQLEVDLQGLLSSTKQDAQPVKLKDNQGRLSRMDEMHNQSILVANRNVTSNRLKSVRSAQQRIVKGSYGYCKECNEPIGFNRLKAYPDAAMCIECQSYSESN